ncbi:hypothetical protein B0H14DRAFT_2767966, partial [Mycena olivaceomarginata]
LWGCISGVRRMLCLEPEAARMVAARGEALNGALGMGRDCRICAHWIGGVRQAEAGSAGVRIPRGTSQHGATGAADAADDAEAARRFDWDGAEDVAASVEATSGTPARRNSRGGRWARRWSCTPGWGCTEAQAPRGEGGIRRKTVMVCLAAMSATGTIGVRAGDARRP